MKKYLFVILLSFLVLNLSGQTIAGSADMIINPFATNPACAGLREDSTGHIFVSHRQLWSNVRFAPSSQLVTYDKRFDALKAGIGITLQNDEMHFFNQKGVRFSYAYHLGKYDEALFSIGASMGIMNQRLDLTQANPKHNQDIIFTQMESWNKTDLDFNLGFNFRFYPFDSENMVNIGGGAVRMLPITWVDTTALIKNKVNGFFYTRWNFSLDDIGSSLEPILSTRFGGQLGFQQMDVDLKWQTFIKRSILNSFILNIGWRGLAKEANYLRTSFGGTFSNKFLLLYNYEVNISGLNYLPTNIHHLQMQITF